MLTVSAVTLGSLGLGLGAVRDTLGVRGFELRCSGNADSQNQSVSYICYPWDPLRFFGSEETLLLSPGFPAWSFPEERERGLLLTSWLRPHRVEVSTVWAIWSLEWSSLPSQ